MDLPGVALVTGAASGIGRATSLLFAAEGCRRVVITDQNVQGLKATSEMISKLHPETECYVIEVDLRNEDSVDHMVSRAAAHWGRLDYCCNVAGLTLAGDTANGSTADWELQYEVLLRGVFFCERAELRTMLSQDRLSCKDSKYDMRGSIVNVSSLAGLIGFPTLPAYAAFKHGVIGLTKSDAAQYGREGVRVNAVCPGAVDTPIAKDLRPGDSGRNDDRLSMISLGRIADPEELAQVIVWLSSSRASYVTGAVISANGGFGGI